MILLVDSGGPDQTDDVRRLIWTFAVYIYMPEDMFLHGAAEFKHNCRLSFSYILLHVPYCIETEKALIFIRKMLISFLFFHGNLCCGYSLEAPH